LNLRLAAWDGLSPLTRTTLATEAASIWRRSHVQLRWLTSTSAAAGLPTLRVLITPDSVATQAEGSRWPVGELLRVDSAVAVAVASVAGARRIVAESDHARVFETQEHQDYRLGLILGRAVAHEIGHFILGTNTHAAAGLMRATIDAREFAVLRTRAFDLDSEAAAHIAALSSPAGLPLLPFDYNR
jgi:hypothetical protein